jgi:hypothetical protein
LESVLERCETTKTHIVTASDGVDTSTDGGRLVARILSSVAQGEVERKGARQRSAVVQAAKQGRWVGGRRPFGYDSDGKTIREDEATLIRQGYEDILAGESLSEVARRWTASGHPTTQGCEVWQRGAVKDVLGNPRNAGLRRHRTQEDRADIRQNPELGITGKADWPPERLAPLAEYVRTLSTPELEQAPGDVSAGAALFVSKQCGTCHDGPSGESLRVYSFTEVGTDSAYANIYNPGSDGKPCCGLGGDSGYVTHGVKAPRMTGVAWQTRFLHNGSVSTLEALFCLSPRPMVTLPAQTAVGHRFTCDGLTVVEKQQLVAYLRAL